MGQNKLENQIREKLNSREIQPSSQAWDRLDAMLSVAEEKKTKRSFGWLYIAAGIAVFLTVGMFLFTQKGTGINNDTNVAGTEAVKDTIQKDGTKFEPPVNKQNQIAESAETQNPKSHNQSSNKEAVSIISQKATINQKQSKNPLINREKQIEFQNSSDVAQKDFPKIDNRNEITVNRSNSLSDEQLLASLDKVTKESSGKQSTVKVDARNLLSQVDGELDQTFREKVINKVSKNYREVKVALANRNNE